MYILKNALRCISRAKARNILISIIVLVIAFSACIGLSIRQAAQSAKESTLEELTITASISYDRSSIMNDMRPDDSGREGMEFDRDRFADMMGASTALTLDEYKTYAKAQSVSDFYYTLTASFNGTDELLPVSDDSTETYETTDASASQGTQEPGGFGGGFPGQPAGGGMSSSDFSVIGYSSDSAMTAFIDGTACVTEGGAMFEEGTTERVCVISQELGIYNNLAVGDTITLTNPSLESETYNLTISGFYESTENNDFSMSELGRNQDPANRILMSAAALELILDESADNSTTITDETTGTERDSTVTGAISATYVFPDSDSYYAFEDQVRALGLDDSYTVSSPDLTAFENSLTPLNTLSTTAGWFLIVILIIGAIILVVLNIFSVRERKYEVGVLTAMGMKKWKVALQFMCEILIVTMIAVSMGAALGAVSSVPVTNALLAGQVEKQTSQQAQREESFGRPDNMGGGFDPGAMSGMEGKIPDNNMGDTPRDTQNNPMEGKVSPFGEMFGGAADYVSEVNSAVNLTVLLQMMAIGLMLTLMASLSSVLFIMRYDPLKILSNRD